MSTFYSYSLGVRPPDSLTRGFAPGPPIRHLPSSASYFPPDLWRLDKTLELHTVLQTNQVTDRRDRKQYFAGRCRGRSSYLKVLHDVSILRYAAPRTRSPSWCSPQNERLLPRFASLCRITKLRPHPSLQIPDAALTQRYCPNAT